jgi:hypothetical protein
MLNYKELNVIAIFFIKLNELLMILQYNKSI